MLYHATDNAMNNYDNNNNYLGRHIAIDRIFWKREEKLGYDIMYCNGATINLQPKPESFTDIKTSRDTQPLPETETSAKPNTSTTECLPLSPSLVNTNTARQTAD